MKPAKKQKWNGLSRTIRSRQVFHRKKKKVFYIDLKKNKDGTFVKMTEACKGKRNTIVVDEMLADAFCEAVTQVRKGGVIDGKGRC
jgi:hypothetical protein